MDLQAFWSAPETVVSSQVDKGLDIATDSDNLDKCNGGYVFRGNVVMVTYNQSRVSDYVEFFQLLTESLLHYVGGADYTSLEEAGVRVYGCQERHEDGSPHYHVLFLFEREVYWRDARRKFAVWRPTSNGREVDTESIRLSIREKYQSVARFITACTAYIEKEGCATVFGKRIVYSKLRENRKDTIAALAIAAASREEAEHIIRRDLPYDYIMRHSSIERFLSKMPASKLPEYTPNFPVNTWCPTPEMEEWFHANMVNKPSGRYSSLLLQGPSKVGKTAWALSFGRPLEVNREFTPDQFGSDFTHVVLNDMDIRTFPYWREFLGCQVKFHTTSKYRSVVQIVLDRPVIWTCNYDNSPLLDKRVRSYIKDCGTVTVKIPRGYSLHL